MRVNNDYTECNADQQVSDPESIFSHWNRVLGLRKTHWDVFIYGRFEIIDREHPSIFCYRRVGKTGTAIIVVNFTDEDQLWPVPLVVSASLASGVVCLFNYELPVGPLDGTLSLRPYEAFVVMTEGEQN